MTTTSDDFAQTLPQSLGAAPCGFRGRVSTLHVSNDASGLGVDEMERRLIELGFVEGATVEVLHEGLFGRDPIAVRVDHATIALRRREAMSVLVVSNYSAPRDSTP